MTENKVGLIWTDSGLFSKLSIVSKMEFQLLRKVTYTQIDHHGLFLHIRAIKLFFTKKLGFQYFLTTISLRFMQKKSAKCKGIITEEKYSQSQTTYCRCLPLFHKRLHTATRVVHNNS